MTTYTSLASGLFAVDEPITSAIGLALRDNPSAIAEGTTGAPVTAAGWHPYNSTVVGTGDGNIFTYSGAVASFESPDFADGYEYRFLLRDVSCTGAANLTIDLYRATSAAYAGTSTIFVLAGAGDVVSGFIDVLFPRRTLRAHFTQRFIVADAADTATGSGTIGTGITNHTTAQKIGKVRFAVSAGNFDGGLVEMYRRRID